MHLDGFIISKICILLHGFYCSSRLLAKLIVVSALQTERLAHREYLCPANGLITHSVLSEGKRF
jgi:hypothetical protein